LVRASLALADLDYQVGNSLLTGQREEASLGLYDYGARWYDPRLGRFIQPDTIVPNPRDAQSFDRYAYVNNNPLKYVDPTGHTGVAIHDSNDGPPVAMSYNTMADIQEDYYNLGVSWTNLPHDVRTAFEAQGATGYMDFHGNATSQNWTSRDPALIGASIYGVGRLIWQLPAMLTGACADDGCEGERRTLEMAVRRADPGVSLQKMGGVVGDALSSRKGFHIGTNIPSAELGLQPGVNGTIVLRALGETKVNPSDYINSVQTLLGQQQNKVFAQLNGIITTYPNTWVAKEAQQLIDIIKRGNVTIVAQ
jgi:RHS repeat-associated protein